MPSAAILVIGSEILSGKVRDDNSAWLAGRLWQLGVDLLEIQVLPDSLPTIEFHVRRLSREVDHVFTSGGIGPTHDDITMQAVAGAFELPLEPNQDLIAMLKDRFKGGCGDDARTQALVQMCTLPVGAELWTHEDLFFPLVTVGNVVILPGVPHLFQRKFDAFSQRFQGQPMESKQFRTSAQEPQFAKALGQIQERWPAVAIGSYPQRSKGQWTALLTLDSRDTAALQSCADEVEALCLRLEAAASGRGESR